jgi:hypothetical protein
LAAATNIRFLKKATFTTILAIAPCWNFLYAIHEAVL